MGKQPDLHFPQHLRIAARTLRRGRWRFVVIEQFQQFVLEQFLVQFQQQLEFLDERFRQFLVFKLEFFFQFLVKQHLRRRRVTG